MLKLGRKTLVLSALALGLLLGLWMMRGPLVASFATQQEKTESKPGPDLVYELKYASSGTTLANPFQLFGQQNQNQSKVQLDFDMRGLLFLRALPPDLQGQRFIARFRTDILTLNVNRQTVQNPELMKALNEERFVLQYGLNHSLVSVQSQSKIPGLVNGLVFDFFHRTQIVLPADPQQPSWEQVENDLNGSYRARYQREGAQLEKQKLSYEPMAGRALEIASSRSTLQSYDSLWHLESWEGEESTRILIKDEEYARSHVKFHLKRLNDFKGKVDLSEPSRLAHSISPDPLRSGNADETRARQVLQGRNLDELLEEFRDDSQNPEADKAHMQRRLVAWVYLHPKELVRLVKVASPLGPQDYLFQSIITGFAEAGSPESHQALVELLQEKRNDPKAAQVVYVGMGMSRNPSQALAEFLQRDYQQEQNASKETAGLTLGAVLRKMDPSLPSVAEMQQSLVQDFQNARMPDEVLAKMRIIGNLGSAQAFESLQGFADDGSLLQRTTAVRSMRFIEDPRVEAYYQTVLRRESNPDLLNAVLLGLSVRTPNTVTLEALRDMVQSTREPGLQISALDLLWKRREQHAWIPELQRSMATEKHYHSRVRSFAQKLVE